MAAVLDRTQDAFDDVFGARRGYTPEWGPHTAAVQHLISAALQAPLADQHQLPAMEPADEGAQFYITWKAGHKDPFRDWATVFHNIETQLDRDVGHKPTRDALKNACQALAVQHLLDAEGMHDAFTRVRQLLGPDHQTIPAAAR